MTIEIVQIDSFTDQPFAGNPAAVCLLETMPESAWMQAVAAEMNVSETAFLARRPDGDFDLRWFTPTVEVDLCGHATLASAHHLWEAGRLAPGETARFHTRSGTLEARRDESWIEMDLPARRPAESAPPDGLLEAIGTRPTHVAHWREEWLVELEGERDARTLKPDFAALREMGVSVIATCRGSGDPWDIVSRYFAPAFGIDEDPATGAAHCCLGPWWQKRLGRDTLMAYQASSRGGVIRVRVEGDRVRLGGQAVTVLRATLAEPAAAGAHQPVTAG